MRNTVLFGNGLNRISEKSVSWEALLDKPFQHNELPNTMVYERIFMEKHKANSSEQADELKIKQTIADAMKDQGSNELFELLAKMKIENYLTTNYDYAFEKAINLEPDKLSTEEIYSLRRKRSYKYKDSIKSLWNLHGEIDHPKSIMLGLDHYVGSVSKIDSYIKGKYKHTVKGKNISVLPMIDKLQRNKFCHTSWVDFFFSSNVHIIGLSLDYSETDIWWLLNKRARYAVEGLVKNKIYFYTGNIDQEKKGLLKSFDVEVELVKSNTLNPDYKSIYRTAINSISA
ncbi:MAG: SIR2 family protein [Planctomycetaceae bacterium]|nr:SIR2 family protein [Planctomycetaceae bacterium]